MFVDDLAWRDSTRDKRDAIDLNFQFVHWASNPPYSTKDGPFISHPAAATTSIPAQFLSHVVASLKKLNIS